MRNRAKCKKCLSVIESFHQFDYVECKCKAIGITGGNVTYSVLAHDFADVLRVDDNDQEVTVTVVEKDEDNRADRPNNENTGNNTVDADMDTPSNGNESAIMDNRQNPSREDLLKELGFMIKNIEELPQHVMLQPITHYDLYSFMLVASSLFRAS